MTVKPDRARIRRALLLAPVACLLAVLSAGVASAQADVVYSTRPDEGVVQDVVRTDLTSGAVDVVVSAALRPAVRLVSADRVYVSEEMPSGSDSLWAHDVSSGQRTVAWGGADPWHLIDDPSSGRFYVFVSDESGDDVRVLNRGDFSEVGRYPWDRLREDGPATVGWFSEGRWPFRSASGDRLYTFVPVGAGSGFRATDAVTGTALGAVACGDVPADAQLADTAHRDGDDTVTLALLQVLDASGTESYVVCDVETGQTSPPIVAFPFPYIGLSADDGEHRVGAVFLGGGDAVALAHGVTADVAGAPVSDAVVRVFETGTGRWIGGTRADLSALPLRQVGGALYPGGPDTLAAPVLIDAAGPPVLADLVLISQQDVRVTRDQGWVPGVLADSVTMALSDAQLALEADDRFGAIRHVAAARALLSTGSGMAPEGAETLGISLNALLASFEFGFDLRALPAAVSVDGPVAASFNGTAFAIDGRPVDLTGGESIGEAVHGVVAPSSAAAVRDALSPSQADRVIGNGTVPDVVGSPLTFDAFAWADGLARQASVELSGRVTDAVGSPDAPVVGHAPAGVTLGGGSVDTGSSSSTDRSRCEAMPSGPGWSSYGARPAKRPHPTS